MVDGVSYIDDKDKAEAFSRTYRKFSQLPDRFEDRKMRRDLWKQMKTKSQTEQEEDCEVSMKEMERAIQEAGYGKSEGEDTVPYEFIKNIGTKAK